MPEPTNPPDPNLTNEEAILAQCNAVIEKYNKLADSVKKQQALNKLMTAFLAGLAVTLLALGLSQECADEIHLVLGGLATAAAIYMSQQQEEEPDPVGTPIEEGKG